MAQKKNMERDCKLTLHSWGVDYHVSVDLDEYELPFAPNVTLVDEIDRMFNKYPNRGTFNVNKLQFNSQPHVLEPIDRLTTEAYQLRFNTINKFNPKVYIKNNHISLFTISLFNCCEFPFLVEKSHEKGCVLADQPYLQ